jgi:PIN domain nuclease of toxin-antitoxin system
MGSELAVLDASAALAFLQRETGQDVVATAIRTGAAISAVNLAEAHSKLRLAGAPSDRILSRLRTLGLAVEPFDELDAEAVGDLRPATKSLGLSLADRACLALAIRLNRPVLTTDRDLARADVGVEVRTIR